MDPTQGILLLTASAETERQVSAAIASERGLAMGPTCRSLQELINRLRQSPARVAVVDLEPSPEKNLALLDPVISRYGDTRFIVLARSPGQQVLLEAMHVGARHVVAAETVHADLPLVLRRMALNGAARRTARAFVASVFSASGGAGATTLAVNLACELQALATGPTLLVDLDVYSGAVAAYLNVHADYDLATVLADGDRLDGELIKSSSALHSPKLYVLLSPGAATSRLVAQPRFENLPALLGSAREAFDYVVIDAPRLPFDMTAQLATASSLCLLPFQLSVVGIRAAKNLMNALIESGVPGDQIMPIASRHRRRRVMIGLDEAARALGRAQLPYLTNDFKSALASVNLGQPLAVAARRSALRRDIERLAQHIHTSHTGGGHLAPVF
ncbi:MAG: AAA family ATPase [Phycisphaerales bacterium]